MRSKAAFLSSLDRTGLVGFRARKNFFIALGVAGCLAIGALGSTLASNISLNDGAVVEFGQGVVQATACDSAITLTPTATFVNGTPGDFMLTGITFSDLDTTDQSSNSQGCAGKFFELNIYQQNGDLVSPTISFAVRASGTLISEDGDITTENSSSETSTAVLTLETPTASARDVYRITFQSMKQDRCYGASENSNGLTEQTPAPSGYWLAQNCPAYESGFYWIQSDAMPNALEMYVDMTEEGGGYDFYFITDGPLATRVTDINGGTALGLDLVMPRSKYHWRAMKNVVANHRPSGNFLDYFANAYGIYRDSEGSMGGNYTSTIMNSDNAPDWKVKDGGRWWLRDTVTSEPNGDYVLNAFLSAVNISESWNLEDFEFNDMGDAFPTFYRYLVSTNAKP